MAVLGTELRVPVLVVVAIFPACRMDVHGANGLVPLQLSVDICNDSNKRERMKVHGM